MKKILKTIRLDQMIDNHIGEIGIQKPDVFKSTWQKGLIDARLEAIKENPNRVLPIETLMEELDS